MRQGYIHPQWICSGVNVNPPWGIATRSPPIGSNGQSLEDTQIKGVVGTVLAHPLMVPSGKVKNLIGCCACLFTLCSGFSDNRTPVISCIMEERLRQYTLFFYR